jgi:hypothetical protein
MLNGGYWQGLKEYYETDYNGVAAGKKATEYAQEMENGGAEFIDYDRPFDPDEILSWIEEKMDFVDEEWSINADESKTLEQFPHLYGERKGYRAYVDEIASYFMWKDLDRFKEEIQKGNQEFADEAVRLEWQEMIEEIPAVKDMFLF